jgi:hypothetical protein
VPPTAPEPAPADLQASLRRLPPTASWALQHLSMPDNGASIAEAIEEH